MSRQQFQQWQTSQARRAASQPARKKVPIRHESIMDFSLFDSFSPPPKEPGTHNILCHLYHSLYVECTSRWGDEWRLVEATEELAPEGLCFIDELEDMNGRMVRPNKLIAVVEVGEGKDQVSYSLTVKYVPPLFEEWDGEA